MATFAPPVLLDNSFIWIGFNDRASEGTWVWSSGEPVTYTNWLFGEPNNCAWWTPENPVCQEEDAAVLYYTNQPSGNVGWNDLPQDGSIGAIVEVTITKAQCKNDGWKGYGVFKNQGDCVSFVSTGGKNLPAS